MTQKVIDVIGVSTKSFAKAAENAVTEAAKTVRGLRWARVAEFRNGTLAVSTRNVSSCPPIPA